jgi:hypothetical protein
VLTVSDRVALKRVKPTSEGNRVLDILEKEYLMTREAALRLMRDGGHLLATAILSKWGR